jgi:hypothetical protein
MFTREKICTGFSTEMWLQLCEIICEKRIDYEAVPADLPIGFFYGCGAECAFVWSGVVLYGHDQRHHRAFAVVCNNRAVNDHSIPRYKRPQKTNHVRLGDVNLISDQRLQFTGRTLTRSSRTHIARDLLF